MKKWYMFIFFIRLWIFYIKDVTKEDFDKLKTKEMDSEEFVKKYEDITYKRFNKLVHKINEIDKKESR